MTPLPAPSFPLIPEQPGRSGFSLLAWRTHYGFHRLEAAVLAMYALLVAFLVPHHEPWADEAQAWLIARDNTLWQIFRYRLHYEGAPGLWHLCLHVLHQLGGGYMAMHWMGAAFAVAGMAVFLRWSPFPLLLRVLLPFTFFFAFQYAVVARGYTLFPLLAFGLCALFRSRRNAVWFALVAGLLANVSLQGTVHSFVMVALYSVYHWRRIAESASSARTRLQGWLRPVALYGLFLLLAAWTAVPAPNITMAGSAPPISGGLADALLTRFPGKLPADDFLPKPPAYAVRAAKLYKPVPFPPLPLDMWTVRPSVWRHPGEWAGWAARHRRYDVQGRIAPPSAAQAVLLTTLELMTLVTAPVSTFKLLACAFLLGLVVWLWFRRALVLLLPWLANVAVSEALWVSDHHMGLLLIGLLTAVWLGVLGWVPEASERRMPRGLDRTLLLLLTLVLVEQVAWTAVTARKEVYGHYDPAPEAAAFLKAHSYGKMAAFDSTAAGVQPYFAQNPFFNLPHSYWVWTSLQNPNGAHATTIAQRPDVVLFSQDMLASGFTHDEWAPLSPVTTDVQNRDLARNPIVRDLVDHGYRETHRFCGERYFRFRSSYKACDLIFEPVMAAR